MSQDTAQRDYRDWLEGVRRQEGNEDFIPSPSEVWREASRRAFEAACLAMCGWCRDGERIERNVPGSEEPWVHPLRQYKERVAEPCYAAEIRTLMEKATPSERINR